RVEDVSVLLLRLDRVPMVPVPEQGGPTAELLPDGVGGAGPPLRSVPVEADRGGAGGAAGDDPVGQLAAGSVRPGGLDGDLGGLCSGALDYSGGTVGGGPEGPLQFPQLGHVEADIQHQVLTSEMARVNWISASVTLVMRNPSDHSTRAMSSTTTPGRVRRLPWPISSSQALKSLNMATALVSASAKSSSEPPARPHHSAIDIS